MTSLSGTKPTRVRVKSTGRVGTLIATSQGEIVTEQGTDVLYFVRMDDDGREDAGRVLKLPSLSVEHITDPADPDFAESSAELRGRADG